MHLTGKANAAYVRGGYAMPDPSSQAATNSRDGGLPPVMWVLFRPAGMRVHKRVIDKGRGEHTPIICGEESCFDTCGAEIDAQECLHIPAPVRKYPSLGDGQLYVRCRPYQGPTCRRRCGSL